MFGRRQHSTAVGRDVCLLLLLLLLLQKLLHLLVCYDESCWLGHGRWCHLDVRLVSHGQRGGGRVGLRSVNDQSSGVCDVLHGLRVGRGLHRAASTDSTDGLTGGQLLVGRRQGHGVRHGHGVEVHRAVAAGVHGKDGGVIAGLCHVGREHLFLLGCRKWNLGLLKVLLLHLHDSGLDTTPGYIMVGGWGHRHEVGEFRDAGVG